MQLLPYYILILSLIMCVSSSTFLFGDKSDKVRLVHTEKVVYQAIPLKKRVKAYEYRGPANLVIKAIRCYDMKNSDASVDITDGGIGTNHFVVRLKSQRHQKLDFEIEVYN